MSLNDDAENRTNTCVNLHRSIRYRKWHNAYDYKKKNEVLLNEMLFKSSTLFLTAILLVRKKILVFNIE